MKLFRAMMALAYPFVIFAGLHWLEPRRLALLLGAFVVLRALLRWRHGARVDLRRLGVPALLVAAILAPTLVMNDAHALLFVPALVNAALLFAFARSLHAGPPLVETFARLEHPELSEAQVRHCRGVTWVWCSFFAANAAVCLGLALAGQLWLWTLYTGFVSYLLMGTIFAVEFVVRSWRFRNYEGTLVEPIFQRLFPQGPAS